MGSEEEGKICCGFSVSGVCLVFSVVVWASHDEGGVEFSFFYEWGEVVASSFSWNVSYLLELCEAYVEAGIRECVIVGDGPLFDGCFVASDESRFF